MGPGVIKSQAWPCSSFRSTKSPKAAADKGTNWGPQHMKGAFAASTVHGQE